MLKTKFPDCLKNAKNDLQLGRIYLKHMGYDEIPRLVTIYELEGPAILAYNEIKTIAAHITDQVQNEYTIKGLFSLAFAHLETMLSDLMRKQLQFFPQKVSLLRLYPCHIEFDVQLQVCRSLISCLKLVGSDFNLRLRLTSTYV